jgi:hypothetical protein
LIRYGQNMKRIQEDPDREGRIQNETAVDASNEEEQAMGWYYYIEDWHYWVARG